MVEACAACAAIKRSCSKRAPDSGTPERGKNSSGLAPGTSESTSFLPAGGAGGAGADDAAPGGGIAAHHHTCGRVPVESLGSTFSISLTQYGMDRKAASGTAASLLRQPQHQQELHHNPGASGFSGEQAEELTPVTVAGAGASTGAEHDTTPLLSRPIRGGGSNSHNASPLLPGPESGEDTSPGLESGSNSSRRGGAPKRKDTITWEAFLANITVGDGEEGGTGSTSDSSSPADSRSHEGSRVSFMYSWRYSSDVLLDTFAFSCLLSQQGKRSSNIAVLRGFGTYDHSGAVLP